MHLGYLLKYHRVICSDSNSTTASALRGGLQTVISWRLWYLLHFRHPNDPVSGLQHSRRGCGGRTLPLATYTLFSTAAPAYQVQDAYSRSVDAHCIGYPPHVPRQSLAPSHHPLPCPATCLLIRPTPCLRPAPSSFIPPPPPPIPRGWPCILGCPSVPPDHGPLRRGAPRVPAGASGVCVVLRLCFAVGCVG